MTTMCVKQLTPRQQVTRYMREIGGKSAGSDAKQTVWVSLGEWGQSFDSWAQAMAYLIAARNAHTDHGKPYPWAS
jgi:hypothetical protein